MREAGLMCRARDGRYASGTARRTSPTAAAWCWFESCSTGFGLAGWIDGRANKEKGSYRPGLMIEVWIALLLYGGGVIDDLPLLERRGVRRIFGWIRVPDPTTFGRWLRRASERMVPLLDELLWRMVRQRWALRARGVPKKLTLTLDSTVVVRYGHKQAGAELGYNPKKRGRRSHHPLVAFVNETGDCLGMRWRAGNAHTAEGATEWLQATRGTPDKRGCRRHHGAPRQGLLQPEDSAGARGAGRIFRA